jgi:hypothetical protein
LFVSGKNKSVYERSGVYEGFPSRFWISDMISQASKSNQSINQSIESDAPLVNPTHEGINQPASQPNQRAAARPKTAAPEEDQ